MLYAARMRAAIYTRISDDREGQGLGVARQRADCEALAEREGWTVADHYSDNDISAYSGADRPAYRRMVADLQAGQVDAIVAWHPDRLHRSPRELEAFIDAVDAAGAAVRTVSAGAVDLSTASGRMTARVAAAVARHESEQKAERVRAKMRQIAESGRSNGGPRTYGYEADHRSVRESEAQMIREAAGRVLAGETLRAIVRDWQQRGVATTRGADWSVQSLRRILTSPRIAGLRSHRGEIVGPAAWPAIIAREAHERLVAEIRSRGGQRQPPRRRLLTGLVHCGKCGAPLAAKVDGGGTRLYRCVRDAGTGRSEACGGLSLVSEAADREVAGQVLAALEGPGLVNALSAAAGDDDERRRLADQLAGDEQRLEQIAGDYAAGEISRSEWRAARERLAHRIAEARRRLADDQRSGVLADLPSGSEALRRRWAEADHDWRVALVQAVVERVDVAPRGHGAGNRLDPARLQVVWRA